MWVVMRPQHRISVLLPQTSFGGETGGRVTNVGFFLRLNNCLLMHCHKLIMNTLDTVEIVCANKQIKEREFWKI